MDVHNELEDDFDLIAELEPTKWSHNNQYYRFLLKKIDKRCGRSLEIGCGTGEFCRLLALKSDQVTGIDLSKKMIEKAKENSFLSNIDFVNQDITECDYPEGTFDCIVSIATMHHLPYWVLLESLKKWLKPAGMLLILDLYQKSTLMDYLYSIAAAPLNLIFCLVQNKRIGQTPTESLYWREHAKHDQFMTLKEIKSGSAEALPGARVKRHLFWRYSLIWQKTP
jgi:SAM-dependent methyltransferase